MIDIERLRKDFVDTTQKLGRRGGQIDLEMVQTLDEEVRQLQTQIDTLRATRNALSIEEAKLRGPALKTELTALEDRYTTAKTELDISLLNLPNIPHDSVPDGTSEADNQEIRRWGTPRSFDFDIRDHVDLGTLLGQMHNEAAAKITGARFTVLTDKLARLQRALIQFMLDVHTKEHGYTEAYMPYIVNADSLRGTGQLPKFAADLFKLAHDQDWYLIPTAEVPVTNIVRDTILSHTSLPLRFVAHTPSFRSEAGSYGKDVRGIFRQHQFEKVELVQIVKPEDSYNTLEDLTRHAETILQKLGLPYRVVALCTADLGFGSAKTYDLEVWLPGQNTYREISSCSNFEDFQARRMLARYRSPDTQKPLLVHTLNGSGLAVGRTLLAIMENYQTTDGSIMIPEALIAYTGFDRISPQEK